MSPSSNGNTRNFQPVDVPPAIAKPYVISSQDGEIIYIPLSKSSTRLLVTGKETDNAFAVVGSSGSQSDPIGFHYHKETHDVFLCLKGGVNVWAGEKCRTMTAGDFASAPPNTIHQYQILGHHSDMVGLIVPGGWEEFFRFIGEPYSGPHWPLEDQRNIFEVLIPKLQAAAEQFDMVPLPQHKQFGPSAWKDSDSVLPGKLEPYFLKAGSGPAWLAGGTVVRPLITTAESDGKFAIGSIEGSSHHDSAELCSENRRICFWEAQHAFLISEGAIEFTLGEESLTTLHAGDLIYVPKATPFTYRIRSRYAKMYAFASGKGIVELLIGIGEDYKHAIPPERPEKRVSGENLKRIGQEVGCEVC